MHAWLSPLWRGGGNVCRGSVSDVCLAAGDLHPPPGRPVLQAGELVAAGAEFRDFPPDLVEGVARTQFDLLAAAHPQQPVCRGGDRLPRGELVQLGHGPVGEEVPLVGASAQGHGGWHAVRPGPDASRPSSLRRCRSSWVTKSRTAAASWAGPSAPPGYRSYLPGRMLPMLLGKFRDDVAESLEMELPPLPQRSGPVKVARLDDLAAARVPGRARNREG